MSFTSNTHYISLYLSKRRRRRRRRRRRKRKKKCEKKWLVEG